MHPLRQRLIDIFDLEPDTHREVIWINRAIYALILLSTMTVILESLAAMQPYLLYLNNFETFVMIVFLAELLLRFAVIKDLLQMYPHSGKRATLLFYFFIDLISVLPPLIVLFGWHAHIDYFLSLRLLRVFKVFRHDHSVEFIIRAIIKKQTELLKSAILVLITSLFLSVLLYEVEYNFGMKDTPFEDIPATMLWVLDVYIDDAGGFGDFAPQTAAGKVIAALVGLLKIAVLVIPTGIVASGFVEVVEEDKLRAEFGRLKSAFRPKYVEKIGKYLYEPPHTMLTVSNALNISEDTVYKIISQGQGFRVRSVLSSRLEKYSDTNIVEYFGYGDFTSYGVRLLDNRRDVLFVCPNSFEEKGIGYFAYCLAEASDGCLISNEFYRKNSLHIDYDFDFLHTRLLDDPDRLLIAPTQPEFRRLSRAEQAFISFRLDISMAANGRTVFVLEISDKIQGYEIHKAEHQQNVPNLVKHILGFNCPVYEITINTEDLDRADVYDMVLSVREDIMRKMSM